MDEKLELRKKMLENLQNLDHVTNVGEYYATHLKFMPPVISTCIDTIIKEYNDKQEQDNEMTIALINLFKEY